nr:DEAD/DEAH box helicase [Micromonospora sp. DSM 115978]
LPAEVRRRHRLPGLWQACELVHRPSTFADVARARTRFKWDEAFVLQIAMGIRRLDNARFTAVPRPARPDGLRAAFDAALPFELTEGQREVGDAIAADMSFSYPMHRLLQGEVASGKTVVALRAMLTAVDAGGQAVLLAPTETLAGQHYRTLRDLLGPLGRAGELDAADRATTVRLVTGSL